MIILTIITKKDKISACNLARKFEKKIRKNRMFLQFLPKIGFAYCLCIIVIDCEYFHNFKDAITQRRHTKTNATFLVPMKGRETRSYIWV